MKRSIRIVDLRCLLPLSLLGCDTASGGGGGGAVPGGAAGTGGTGAGGTGSGGSAGVGGTAAHGQAAHEGCTSVMEAMCDRLFACYSAEELMAATGGEEDSQFTDADTCATGLVAEVCSDMQSAVTKGTALYDESQGQACNSAIASVPCGDSPADLFQSEAPSDACDAIITGTIAHGEACVYDEECSADNAGCIGGLLCSGELNGEAYEAECTEETAANCAGLSCLTLNDNVEGKTGMCTLGCSGHSDCGEGGLCVNIEQGQICFSTCGSNADCSNGFVCMQITEDGGKACFVEAL